MQHLQKFIILHSKLINKNLAGICTSSWAYGLSNLPRLKHKIPDSRKNVEESTAEWCFVERLLPPPLIPKPSLMEEVGPSGWYKPFAKPSEYSYFVARNASYMVPVYLNRKERNVMLKTIVKNIHGDIFALGEDLKKYISEYYPDQIIGVTVYEPYQKIVIRGDHYNLVKNFLKEKGF